MWPDLTKDGEDLKKKQQKKTKKMLSHVSGFTKVPTGVQV